jgi:hypothetical protein
MGNATPHSLALLPQASFLQIRLGAPDHKVTSTPAVVFLKSNRQKTLADQKVSYQQRAIVHPSRRT